MRVIPAVLRREVEQYFSTPAGYVFISLFVFLSAMAAFWQESFFAANLANLDALNRFFPYLLIFFIPAIAMSLWADERKQGTEDLLLALPAADWQIVAGKYLAAVAIYTVSLLFSLSHLIVLRWLGAPDPGLMITTYFGYWLAGSALLALAMVASHATDNLTVAFLLGALLCAAMVFAEQAGAVVTGAPQRILERLSVARNFQDLANGVVTLPALTYFLGLAALSFILNVVLLGRRRWPTGPASPRLGWHWLARTAALFAALAALVSLAAQSRWRLDATSEQVHSLSPDTQRLLGQLNPQQPVFIYAYLSPEVPKSYVAARANLVAVLREVEARSRQAVFVKIIETLKYTPAAREAQERYNIRPYRVPVTEEGAQSNPEIFLGLALTCGSAEFVIPFLDRGLPAEYELARSLRVVTGAQRRKVGILQTPARLFGGFDFQSRSSSTDWSIVAELRKQYDVQPIASDAEYPANLDVLLAVMPGALPQADVDRLAAYARSGKPLLLLMDPFPGYNAELTNSANLTPLLQSLGLAWTPNRIAWDSYNPHPQLKTLPKEFVFIGKGFHPQELTTSGLQEVVLLYPGALTRRSDTPNQITPLLETTPESGTVRIEDLIQRGIMGNVQFNPDLPHKPDQQKRMLAARVTGSANAIVVADSDLISEQFFELRKRGIENLNFDNVTFILNAVDQLAGDSSFIALRKRRPRHRTLEAVEAQTRQFEAQRLREMEQAESTAAQRLQEAQDRLNRAVREVEARADLDEQAKQITISNLTAAENRRLAVARTTIEDEKQRQIELSRVDMESSIRRIQSTIKLLAVTLPPIPALVLFVVMAVRRRLRERMSIPADRLVEASHA
jgi:ABC-2 type transport system permease protein